MLGSRPSSLIERGATRKEVTMRGLGIGIGKILEVFGAESKDVAWMHKEYPKALKKLQKHPHFAEHGEHAKLLADFYICGFFRGINATGLYEAIEDSGFFTGDSPVRKTARRKKHQ
jgi:hypothetical protein